MKKASPPARSDARRGPKPKSAARARSTAPRHRAAPPPPARAAQRPPRQPAARRRDAAADQRIRRALFSAWRAAEAKKAPDTVALDVRGLADFTDYFLITEGANARQVDAITAAIEHAVARAAAGGGPRLAHREGGAEAEWRVLDYLDFVVHVFSAASRRFYALERLWQKAPRLALPAPRPARTKA